METEKTDNQKSYLSGDNAHCYSKGESVNKGKLKEKTNKKARTI